MEPLQDRPYRAEEILSYSYRLFKENYRLVILLVLTIYLPINLLEAFLSGPIDANEIIVEGLPVYAITGTIILGLVALSADLAIVYAVNEAAEGRKPDYKSSLARSLSRWPTAVGTEILGAIFLAGLLLLLILPGILYAVYWSFALYAVVLRGKSGKGALSYSKALVKGRWWKVLSYSLTFAIVLLIPLIPVALLEQITPANPYTDTIYQTLTSLITAFYTVASTVFFLNLEKVKPSEEKKKEAPAKIQNTEPVINRL